MAAADNAITRTTLRRSAAQPQRLTVDGIATRAPNQALAHALQVLDVFIDGPGSLGISEISRHVGIDKSTVSRIVATLVQHGFISRAEDQRRYQVGPMAWMLGVRYRLAEIFAETARVVFGDLLRRFAGTTGYAGIRYGGYVRYVAVVDGPGAQRVHLEVGEKTPMAMIALGRVMLAHLPDEELHSWRESVSPEELPVRFRRDKRGLTAELTRIRTQGFGINRGDQIPEIGAIASPVLRSDGTPLGAIAADFAMRSVDKRFWVDLAPAVVAAAKQTERIMSALGGK